MRSWLETGMILKACRILTMLEVCRSSAAVPTPERAAPPGPPPPCRRATSQLVGGWARRKALSPVSKSRGAAIAPASSSSTWLGLG
eukprot:scaffold96710_cov44-Phaeocystis_antarctica.AAC.2